ncbi:MAG: 4Fe-4S binding protein [Desulfobacteraceae bacterium]|nr:4Fe-4S binding protein [Desulfobacteraceae bacterium]
MNFIAINDEKCDRCGTCVAECPERVIEMTHKESVPSVTEFGKDLYIFAFSLQVIFGRASIAKSSK